jgi:hypothetical protein
MRIRFQPRVLPNFFAVTVLLTSGLSTLAQPAVVRIEATADAFVRNAAPSSNYGSSGSLSVSGSAAVNGAGQSMGRFDALIRFPLGQAVNSFDASFGKGNWTVAGVTLKLNEIGAPGNGIFNRGAGSFEIRWIASDSWSEGTGGPSAPTSDGIAYQDLGATLNMSTDLQLGVFSNIGLDGQRSFSLGLPDLFVKDIQSAGEISFYLTAVDPMIGFNFNSRNFGIAAARPLLEIALIPEPRTVWLFSAGAAVSVFCGRKFFGFARLR